MAKKLLNILVAGDPVLRKVAEPVTRIDKKLHRLLKDMADTMYASDGVGLAAPQIGRNDRIVVIDPSDGRVCAEVDCSGIYPRSQRRIEDDVLNGIAFDSASGKIYLTGKNWPCLYEISIEGIRPGRRK